MSTEACAIPDSALLAKYRDAVYANAANAYTDCFATPLRGELTLADFVNAFYTTWLFKLERLVIQYLAGKRSTDADVARLADGSAEVFAVWTVEARTPAQLLLCDDRGRTRSWLMVEPISQGDQAHTLLRFGSAIVPETDSNNGKTELGMGFRLLLPIHRVYSRLLLRASRARLLREQ